MSEVLPPPSRWRKSIKLSINDLPIAKPINDKTKQCPGCLYNCYIMEETLGLDFTGLGAFFRSLIFTLAEIPTLIQMAKVMANREKSGWGKGVEVESKKKSNILHEFGE